MYNICMVYTKQPQYILHHTILRHLSPNIGKMLLNPFFTKKNELFLLSLLTSSKYLIDFYLLQEHSGIWTWPVEA